MIPPPPSHTHTHTHNCLSQLSPTPWPLQDPSPVQGGSGVLNMRGMLQDAIKEASAAIEGPEVSWERSAFVSGSRQ